MSKAAGGVSSTRTVGTFLLTGRACSDTLFHLLGNAFDHPLIEEERAAQPLAGGMLLHGYQCGMIWGAALAAGARAHRLFGDGAQAGARAIVASARLVDAFRALNESTDCFDITQINSKSTTLQMITYFLIKGGTIGCARMAARYAPVALGEIDAAFSSGAVEAPPAPASCSALLAQRMGVSDMHVVMAAGLAGGIGLSGGCCGALGAAIWIIGMKGLAEGRKVTFKDPRGLDAIERFVKCSNYEFECSAILGRRFESIEDHACWVRGGGCSRIIEALAAQAPAAV